jgi:MOSC domain-containing protein YiiM
MCATLERFARDRGESMAYRVVEVHKRLEHAFSKTTVPSIELVPGHGVRDDAHFGVTVKHRSRVAKDPTQPNLRQVHLLHEELFAEVAESGRLVLPGRMGENITTQGIDLLGLSMGARLKIGTHAVIEITGLRNPCAQIENFQSGLLAAVVGRAADGSLVRKAGVMAIVLEGGFVRRGDTLEIVHAPREYKPLLPI